MGLNLVQTKLFDLQGAEIAQETLDTMVGTPIGEQGVMVNVWVEDGWLVCELEITDPVLIALIRKESYVLPLESD